MIRPINQPSRLERTWNHFATSITLASLIVFIFGKTMPMKVACAGGGCSAVAAPATITSTSGYGLTMTASGNDADNRAIDIHQSANGALVHGLHILSDGAATASDAMKTGCVNATSCISLQTNDGNVVFNSQSGTFQDNGSTTLAGSPVTIGLGGTSNAILVEKHNTAPAATSCGTSPTVTGGNSWFTLTTGSAATACTVTFATPQFGAAPTCTVVAQVGTNQSGLSYTTSTSALTLSAAAASAVYHVECVGH